MKVKPKFVFIGLIVLFIGYTAMLYLLPLKKNAPASLPKYNLAETRLVWQKYNCQSCHQIYGLGGYLGPDLTNLMSKPGKNKAYLNGILQAGVRQMPVFKLTNEEVEQLYRFFIAINQSGYTDYNGFNMSLNGMIE